MLEENKKYFWAEVPVEIVEGKKEYDVTAVALTRNEWNAARKKADKQSQKKQQQNRD